jgi:cytochrome c551/c552
MPRTALSLTLVAAAIALTATGIALAGGWAVATVHPLGTVPVAGKPTTLSLSVRQHGRTLVRVDDVALEIVARDGTSTRFPARPLRRAGTYAADVTFPAAGTYRWRAIKGWFGPQELGRIRVAAPGRMPVGSALDGRSLFLAKGCGVCHFGPDSEAQVSVGPALRDLAERYSGKAGLAYLRLSIRKPDAVIAGGGSGGTFSDRMPLLEVSAAEADVIARYLVSRRQ